MARKKTTMTEPEYSDTNPEETLQLPEGEVPTEGVQEDTMSMGGDVSVGEAMPDSGEVPDSGAPSGDGDAAFPDAESPLTDDSVGEGFSSEEPSPGGIPREDAADDSQYKDLLHEMESTMPLPPAEGDSPAPQGDPPPLMEVSEGDMLPETSTAPEQNPMETANAGETPTERAARPRARRAPPTQRSDYVLTIDARDRIQTEEEREEIIWHEIRNAYRTRRVLTGIWGGVEQTQSGRTLAIVDYKGFRVAIPILEMLLYTGEMPSNCLLEAAACKKILKELERLAEKYKRKIDREQAARKAEFEAVMQYSSEKDILDAYGWEFITEKQYDRYLELFREGQNALEHHAPTCSEIAYDILCRMAASVQRDIQEWEFCALTPEQQRTARERAEKNLIGWKRKIAEIKKSAVL